ncbi:MAG: TonB-dependent receptor [Pseudomonadota bacterium]
MTTGFKALSLAALLSSASTLAVAQEDQPFDLGTLVIRGEKINRTSSDAPTSISVIRAEELEDGSITDLDDALSNQANVLADEGIQTPAIRGLDGTGGPGAALTAGSQPRIPILVDGVPLPSGDSTNISRTTVWDLDTVEIARGPQAVSTGRNALGGAIRVFTKDPVFASETALRFRVNSDGDGGVDFLLNRSLIPGQLALRLTGEFTNGQSYIDNFPNPVPTGLNPNEEEIARLRAKLLYEPDAAPGLSILFLAERNRSDGPGEGFFTGNIDDLTVNTPAGFSSTNSIEKVDHDVFSVQVTYDFNDRLTGVARLSRTDNTLVLRDTGELFSVGENRFQKELTEAEAYLQFQDVGLISTGVVGVIHSEETEDAGNNGLIGFIADAKIENTALYGEVELDASGLVPGLAVIIGGRAEQNKLRRNVVSTMGVPIGSTNIDETVFLPKFGLRYDISDTSAIGYGYSEGYRIGGIDSDLLAPFFFAPFSISPFGSERLHNHEIYGRTTVAGGALDLQASAFFYILDNAQVVGAGTFPGSGLSSLSNVPEAQGYGAEFSANYRATDRWTFNANLGLTRTEITEVGAGQAAFLGLDLPRAPETTASVGIDYDNGSGFTASAQARFVSSRETALLQPSLDSHTVVDLGIGYETDVNGTTVQFDAYVDNLFDERYRTYDLNNLRSAGAPRTVGASMTVRF